MADVITTASPGLLALRMKIGPRAYETAVRRGAPPLIRPLREHPPSSGQCAWQEHRTMLQKHCAPMPNASAERHLGRDKLHEQATGRSSTGEAGAVCRASC